MSALQWLSPDGTDYVGQKCQLTFEQTSISGVRQCVVIEIIDDRYKEENETLAFVLSAGGDEAVHIVAHDADVEIIDNDSM